MNFSHNQHSCKWFSVLTAAQRLFFAHQPFLEVAEEEVKEGEIKLTMSTGEYNSAVEQGVFGGIYYRWSLRGDMYIIYLPKEDYQTYQTRLTEISAGDRRIFTDQGNTNEQSYKILAQSTYRV